MTEYVMCGDAKKIELFLKSFPFINYIIYGEGEAAFLKLIKSLEIMQGFEKIDNVAYLDGADVKINKRAHADINEQALPDYDMDSLKKYQQVQLRQGQAGIFNKHSDVQLPYQLSRGCPQQCSFCNYQLVDPQVQMKTHQRAVEDLISLKKKYKTSHFIFCECKINISYNYINKLCDILIEKSLNIHWFASASIVNMDSKLLKKMYRAGCYGLAFGIESGSDVLLDKMHKGFCANEASTVLKLSKQAGIANVISLICDFIGETDDDIEKTCEFIKKNISNIDKVIMHNFMLVPSSPIAESPQVYQIENVFIDYALPMGYEHMGFDEVNGRDWKSRMKQQEEKRRILNDRISAIFQEKAY